jgi:hypothetical protein
LGEYQLAGFHLPPADGFLQLYSERVSKSSENVGAAAGLGLRVGLRLGLRVGLEVGLRVGLEVGLRVGLRLGLGARGAEEEAIHSTPFQKNQAPVAESCAHMVCVSADVPLPPGTAWPFLTTAPAELRLHTAPSESVMEPPLVGVRTTARAAGKATRARARAATHIKRRCCICCQRGG